MKGRAYGERRRRDAARRATPLATALSTLLRLFAPFLPFVTEEVWSWWQEGSIHRAGVAGRRGVRRRAAPTRSSYTVAAEVLGAVRKEKSEQKVSLATPVERVVVHDTAERLAALNAALADVCEAGKIRRASRSRSAPSSW